MSEELKPCPFCGGAAVLKYTASIGFTQHLGVICCQKCKGQSKETFADLAPKRWNTRTPDPSVLVEALEEITRLSADNIHEGLDVFDAAYYLAQQALKQWKGEG